MEKLAIHVSTDWRRRPIRVDKHRRVCATRGCETILSRYNPRSKCSIHERKQLLESEDVA